MELHVTQHGWRVIMQMYDGGAGYCVFNDVAVAAHYLLELEDLLIEF